MNQYDKCTVALEKLLRCYGESKISKYKFQQLIEGSEKQDFSGVCLFLYLSFKEEEIYHSVPGIKYCNGQLET